MKHLLLSLCLTALMFSAKAQDTIITTLSEKMVVEILETSDMEVKFREYGNPQGEIFTLPKSQIEAILIANTEYNEEKVPVALTSTGEVSDASSSIHKKGRRSWDVVRENGWQLTGDFLTGFKKEPKEWVYGLSLTASYRFNIYLSAGVGFVMLFPDSPGFFLRGTYRPLYTKLSPLICLDGGYRWSKDKTHAFYVKPSMGVSWRMAGNSYLELKVGAPVYPEEESTSLEASLGFTYAFKLLSNKVLLY